MLVDQAELPGVADGIYWLRTNTLVQPQQFYCDMTTDGGGWVLIGRGREGWSFHYKGQGTAARSATRSPARTRSRRPRSSTDQVNGLMNGGRMDGLTDGIRRPPRAQLHRHDLAGGPPVPDDLRQVVVGLRRRHLPEPHVLRHTCTNISASSSGYQDTAPRTAGHRTAPTAASTRTRCTSHNWRAGFWYGSQRHRRREQRHELPLGVHERGTARSRSPRCSSARRSPRPTSPGARAARHRACPRQTVRPMLDQPPVDLPVAGHRHQQRRRDPARRLRPRLRRASATRIYVGGKFRQVQHGPGGPNVTQTYLAAFDKNTGEWIPTFNPVINAPVWKI